MPTSLSLVNIFSLFYIHQFYGHIFPVGGGWTFLNGSHLAAAIGTHGQDFKDNSTRKTAKETSMLEIFISRQNCTKVPSESKNHSSNFLPLSLSFRPSSENFNVFFHKRDAFFCLWIPNLFEFLKQAISFAQDSPKTHYLMQADFPVIAVLSTISCAFHGQS